MALSAYTCKFITLRLLGMDSSAFLVVSDERTRAAFLTFMIKVKNFTGVIFIDLVNAQMRVRGTAGFVMCIWPKSNCLYTASEEPIHLQD